MVSKINRCPKCGRVPEVIRLERKFVLSAYEVECYDCGLHTGYCKTYEEAIAKWNELTKGEINETKKENIHIR
jgi:hypothetical protein